MIEVVPETGSTNADIGARLRDGVYFPEGSWLVADRQTSGRGRQGREWSDGAGNFMGSTAVHLGPGDPLASTLALVTGLAVYEAVHSAMPDFESLCLKWPNDLMVGNAKLAGILLERQRNAVIAGIGVNLASAPGVPGRETVSLAELGSPVVRDVFAQWLAESFARELDRWRTYGLEPCLRRWLGAAHPPGTPLTVVLPGEEALTGTFAGLSDDGALQLRLMDGTTRTIHAGDVLLTRQ